MPQKYDAPTGPPPNYPSQPAASYQQPMGTGHSGDYYNNHPGSPSPQGQYYGPPQGQYMQQGQYPPQGYQAQGYPPQGGMYYAPQGQVPPGGYYAGNRQQGGSAADGICAGLCGALACCCCLDILF